MGLARELLHDLSAGTHEKDGNRSPQSDELMDELIESLFTEELGGIRQQQRRRQQQAQGAPSERQQPQAEGDPAQRGQHAARPAGSRLTRRQRQQQSSSPEGGSSDADAPAAAPDTPSPPLQLAPRAASGGSSPNGSENSTGSRLKADDLLQAHPPARARPPARPPARRRRRLADLAPPSPSQLDDSLLLDV